MRSLAICVPVLAMLAAQPAGATTVVPMDLEELVRQAGWILEGTVVKLEPFATGSRPSGEPRTVVPAPPRTEEAGTVPGPYEDPAPLGVEGGRMIHTRVTLRVDREIVGRIGPTVTFHVAGGTLGDERAVVFGLPTFELGERVVVFLRPDFETTGSPLVGVHQGFFRVAERASDRVPLVLDSDGDVVVAVAAGRAVVQRNPDLPARPGLALGPVPTPEAGADVHAGRSPEVDRYWRAADPPLPPARFYAAIRNLRGVAR